MWCFEFTVVANKTSLLTTGQSKSIYLENCIGKRPAFLSSSALPGRAMAPKAVPLRSKWTASDRQPGHSSAITTLTGLDEHRKRCVHLTYRTLPFK